MRPISGTPVFWRACAVAGLVGISLAVQTCGGGDSPAQPTPPARTTLSTADIAGAWQGGISLWSYDGDTGHITLTLTQTGDSVSGTFECLYRCVTATGSLRGTISGTTLTGRIEFPDGRSCETFGGMLSAQGLSGRYACAGPLGKDGTVNGSWTAARVPASQCVPELISPANNASVDNGRVDRRDVLTWEFIWTDCPGARYHLLVSGFTAMYPLIDARELVEPSLRSERCGSYVADPNRAGWRWRVRASVGGVWGNWSREGVFDVEPLDRDPPGLCP